MDGIENQYGSMSSINNPVDLGGGVTNENYLKVLTVFLNRSQDSGVGRQINIKDFDKLDSETLQKILIFLLDNSGIYELSDFQGKIEVLLSLAQTGCFPPLEFDGTIDHIYWAIKRIIPPNDSELLHYGMLYSPEKFPKAVKNLLRFIVQFVLFVDNCSERFEKIRDDVSDEQQKRTELQQEVNDIKTKIVEEISKKSDRRNQIPILQEELSEKNRELRVIHDANSELERQKTEARKVYDVKEIELIKLQKELDEIIQARKIVEDQIVSNPDDLIAQLRMAQEELEKRMKKRDELGARVQDSAREVSVLEQLIVRCKSYVGEVQRVMDTIEEIEHSATEMEEKRRQIEELSKVHLGRQNDLHFLKSNYENAKEEYQNKISSLESHIKRAKQLIVTVSIECKEYETAIEQVSQESFNEEEINCEVLRQLAEMMNIILRLKLLAENNCNKVESYKENIDNRALPTLENGVRAEDVEDFLNSDENPKSGRGHLQRRN